MSEGVAGGAVEVLSNMGMLVLYDPAQLKDKVKSAKSWWERAPLATEERAAGKYAAWPLGGGKRATRDYRARLGRELSELERAYLRGSSPPTPLHVVSEEVFLGPGERMPGDGFGDRISHLPRGGDLLPFAPGRYSVVAHVLDWRPDDRFWTEENEPTADAPPDFVLLWEPVEALPPAPAAAAVTPLLELLPAKEPTARKSVQVGNTWRSRHRTVELDLDDGSKRRRRADGEPAAPRAPRAKKEEAAPIQVAPPRPGELCVGATVRHPVYGVGKVLFARDGFPKVKVAFQSSQEKVDKDELTVVS
jgi:hypothetical protein